MASPFIAVRSFRVASLLPGRVRNRPGRRGTSGKTPRATGDPGKFLLGLDSGRLPDTLRGAHRMAPAKFVHGIILGMPNMETAAYTAAPWSPTS